MQSSPKGVFSGQLIHARQLLHRIYCEKSRLQNVRQEKLLLATSLICRFEAANGVIWQDKVSRRVVGWQLSETMTADLIIEALQKAIKKRLIKVGAIVHSDRGSQYATDFRALLVRHCFRQSMSGKGNCYENAQAESFFSRFKAELVEGDMFEDLEQAKAEVFSYIEGYYNRIRLHSALGYKTPLEYEAELKIKEKRSTKRSFVFIFT